MTIRHLCLLTINYCKTKQKIVGNYSYPCHVSSDGGTVGGGALFIVIIILLIGAIRTSVTFCGVVKSTSSIAATFCSTDSVLVLAEMG